jgi:hypothetical protein
MHPRSGAGRCAAAPWAGYFDGIVAEQKDRHSPISAASPTSRSECLEDSETRSSHVLSVHTLQIYAKKSSANRIDEREFLTELLRLDLGFLREKSYPAKIILFFKTCRTFR